MSAEPSELTKAANLLRSAGYAVTYRTDAENWTSWLEQAQERNRATHDEVQQLIWHHGMLLADITRALAPSRPRWLREARAWWNRGGWSDPVVFNLPQAVEQQEAS